MRDGKALYGKGKQHNSASASIYTQINLILIICFFFPLPLFTANTGLYAHYVFNTLDKDHTGTLSFEVS
jgi:hypothetical protein